MDRDPTYVSEGHPIELTIYYKKIPTDIDVDGIVMDDDEIVVLLLQVNKYWIPYFDPDAKLDAQAVGDFSNE
ncbi:unnamed protein product [Cunninghamella blakesleeana]